MMPSQQWDDWIVGAYADGMDAEEIGRRTGLTTEQVLAVVSATTAGPDAAAHALEETIVGSYAQYQDPELIAQRTGLSTAQVYEVLHRSSGVRAPYRMEGWVIAVIVAGALVALLALAAVVFLVTR